MLEFKKLTLDTVEQIKPYLALHPQRLCDWTIGGTYIWRDAYKYSYAIANNTLIFRLRIFDDQCAFTVPLGENPREAMRLLDQYCDECAGEGNLQYCMVGEADLKLLEESYAKMEVIPDRDSYDYLYEAADLKRLRGKVHRSTRNNINRFNRFFPNNDFRIITPALIPSAHDFLDSFVTVNEGENYNIEGEAEKIHEVLDNMELYEAFGAALFAEDKMVGFSLGEIKDDTLYVHVEKANTNYRGSYQMLMKSFVEEFARDEVIYVNREDDAGDAGLRKSKLSYNPVKLLRKYLVKDLQPK